MPRQWRTVPSTSEQGYNELACLGPAVEDLAPCPGAQECQVQQPGRL